MPRPFSAARQAGFSLIELIIIMAILGMLALFGMPAILAMGERAKLQSTAREVASMMRLARLEAVKGSRPAGVQIDFSDRELVAFVDDDGNDRFALPDRVVGRTILPTGVEFWGPLDGAAGGANATVGFAEGVTDGTAMFDSLGAAEDIGAFRLRGKAQNFIEIRVDPPVTGKVTVQKWFGGAADANWYEQGEDGKTWKWYEEGETPTP